MRFAPLLAAMVLAVPAGFVAPRDPIHEDVAPGTCGGGGGGGIKWRPRWSDAQGVAELNAQQHVGIVYCLLSDKELITIWDKRIAELSFKIPFVMLRGAEGDDLAKRVKVDTRPAIVMADAHGNPIWGFGGKLQAPAIGSALEGLPRAVAQLEAKVPKDLAAAQAQAADPKQRAKAMASLRTLAELKGYAEALRAKELHEKLLAEGQQELDQAMALLATDKPAARRQLDEIARRYPETPIAQRATAAKEQR